MPTYNMVCKKCGDTALRRSKIPISKIEDPAEMMKLLWCMKCNDSNMTRQAQPPSTVVKEVLDNGAMAKAVERIKDAEELYRDRADGDPKLKR